MNRAKKSISGLLISLSVLFSSCDPDVADEGINLAGMEFAQSIRGLLELFFAPV